MKTFKQIILTASFIFCGLNISIAENTENDTTKKINIINITNYFNENLFVTALKQSLASNDYSNLDAFWADSVMIVFSEESGIRTIDKIGKSEVKSGLSCIVNKIPTCQVRLFRTQTNSEKNYTVVFIIPKKDINIYVNFYVASGEIYKLYFH